MDFPELIRKLVKDIETQNPYSKKFTDYHLREWTPLIYTLKPSWTSSEFTTFTDVLLAVICSTQQCGLSEVASIQFNCRFTLEVLSSSLWECICPDSYTSLLRMIHQVQTEEEEFICRSLLYEFFLEHIKSGGIQSPVLSWILNFLLEECSQFFFEFPGTEDIREEFLTTLGRISLISGYDDVELKDTVDRCIARFDRREFVDHVQLQIQKHISTKLRMCIDELEQLVNTPSRMQQTAWHLSKILTSKDIYDCAPLRFLIQYYAGEFPDQVYPTIDYMRVLGTFGKQETQKLKPPKWLTIFCSSSFDLIKFEVDLGLGMESMLEEDFDNWIDFSDFEDLWKPDDLNIAILSNHCEYNHRLVVLEIGEILGNTLNSRMYSRLLSALGLISNNLSINTDNMEEV
ncbi:hypothetical protein K7432_003279 [Basidiobolus ranarum]|uniref:SRCR domain-containing protein n=1 Tax=Basidiobolus ranarum TaxID=34480 RepID=A0ABR2W6E7_9FUNG